MTSAGLSMVMAQLLNLKLDTALGKYTVVQGVVLNLTALMTLLTVLVAPRHHLLRDKSLFCKERFGSTQKVHNYYMYVIIHHIELCQECQCLLLECL